MKIGSSFYSRALFALAFVVLIATNIFVLTGVSANRSGPPEAQLTLTERELSLPYWSKEENSGLALRLSWRVLPREADGNQYVHWRSPAWLDDKKLADLGFELGRFLDTGDDDFNDKYPIPKEVYVVLELGGAPYKAALQRAQAALASKASQIELDSGAEDASAKALARAEEELLRERVENSRLFAIDAGLDPVGLRQTYPDRKRFIITTGLVEPRFVGYTEEKLVEGSIKSLSIEKIHVPLELRPFFESLPLKTPYDKELVGNPRYQVELAYGSRFEPWIKSVKPIDWDADAFEGSDDTDWVGLLIW